MTQRSIIMYGITLLLLCMTDSVWLMLTAHRLYRPLLGHLMAPEVRSIAIIIAFYVLYAYGINELVINPLIALQGTHRMYTAFFLKGALLGLVAYGAYNFTNFATLRNWPALITIIDLTWGTFMTGLVSILSALIKDAL